MKARYITLPSSLPSGTVEGCAAPLAYLAWLAWPHENQQKHRDDCFKGGMASIAKAAGVKRTEFPDSLKGRKPRRVDDKLNHAFEIILRRRWRAISMLAWRMGDGLSQQSAAGRLLDWSIDNTPVLGEQATRGIYVDQEADWNLSSVRARVWRDSAPVLPAAWGFFSATGYMRGAPLQKATVLSDPSWVTPAVDIAADLAEDIAAIEPDTCFILPRTT